MELQKQNSCCSARRDSETEERKKVLNRCFSILFQTRQSCTLVCICSSFIFYAPRLSFGRYCSLCEENEMSKVRCKSKSPLSRLAWSQCRAAAQCSWDLRSTSLLHPEQGARLGIKRLRNNVFRLSSTSTGSLNLYVERIKTLWLCVHLWRIIDLNNDNIKHVTTVYTSTNEIN